MKICKGWGIKRREGRSAEMCLIKVYFVLTPIQSCQLVCFLQRDFLNVKFKSGSIQKWMCLYCPFWFSSQLHNSTTKEIPLDMCAYMNACDRWSNWSLAGGAEEMGRCGSVSKVAASYQPLTTEMGVVCWILSGNSKLDLLLAHN